VGAACRWQMRGPARKDVAGYQQDGPRACTRTILSPTSRRSTLQGFLPAPFRDSGSSGHDRLGERLRDRLTDRSRERSDCLPVQAAATQPRRHRRVRCGPSQGSGTRPTQPPEAVKISGGARLAGRQGCESSRSRATIRLGDSRSLPLWAPRSLPNPAPPEAVVWRGRGGEPRGRN
jgi:hypothetical protein